MQYMNNDMDELFRRAAESYPLDTGTGDWNKVASLLENSEEQVVKKNNGRKYLWLLLLLPMALICNQYFQNGNNETRGTTKNINKEQSGRNALKQNEAVPSGKQEVPASQSVTNSGGKADTKTTTGSYNVNQLAGPGNQKSFSFNNRNMFRPFGFRLLQKGKNENLNIGGDVEPFYDPVSVNSVTNISDAALSHMRITKVQSARFLSHTLQLKDHAEYNVLIGENIPTPAPPARKRRLYAGIMTGIDVTTVKFQQVDHAGYDYGLLLGYYFAPRWSAELGAYMDKKFYYSDGKYFNNSKLYLPPNSKVTEVYGDCRMIELPLSLRYDLSSSGKNKWFATTGISSYLMKKEQYSYVYYYGSTGTYATHDKTYNNASKNIFSVLQFSAGYNHRLGKVGDLRIEPYFKVPLSGMGYGSLPLLSGGLHVGITR